MKKNFTYNIAEIRRIIIIDFCGTIVMIGLNMLSVDFLIAESQTTP